VSILFLSISASGLLSLMPIFWTLPGTVLSGVAAAAGIGMINAIGNLSGFTGSMITKASVGVTGSNESRLPEHLVFEAEFSLRRRCRRTHASALIRRAHYLFIAERDFQRI